MFTTLLGVGKVEQLEESSIYGTAQAPSANRLSTSLLNNFFFSLNFEYEECVPHDNICLVTKIK